jgi:HTH-type transcriptional regulator/antitoxin HipB
LQDDPDGFRVRKPARTCRYKELEPMTMTPLAQDVQARRKDLGLTQQELADLAGCSPRFVRALEAGKASVQLDKLLAVLDVLGLELETRRRVPE